MQSLKESMCWKTKAKIGGGGGEGGGGSRDGATLEVSRAPAKPSEDGLGSSLVRPGCSRCTASASDVEPTLVAEEHGYTADHTSFNLAKYRFSGLSRLPRSLFSRSAAALPASLQWLLLAAEPCNSRTRASLWMWKRSPVFDRSQSSMDSC